jgi:hypothetical protein
MIVQQTSSSGAHRLAAVTALHVSWSGDRLSEGVQRAIYHEARRRGLGQSEIAALVGLSRSYFANLLSGRFGASAESAARIRDFLIAGALMVGGSP